MKVLYSQIKELIPTLDASAKEVADILTLTGFMTDAFEEVKFQNKKDWLIGLEVRQNRGDGQSAIGVAREVAAYYGLKVKLPFCNNLLYKKSDFKIKVESSAVKRIIATKISGLKNNKSPIWLIDFLAFYDINSINFLVDLSNYVMLVTGFPSHLLDFNKVDGPLLWDLNSKFNEIITLDNSSLKLKKGELIIRDNSNILALAGVVGGESAKIDMNTEIIIAEIATYDDEIIRRDSRNLNTVTDASNRLSKKLDPNGLQFASDYLVSLILVNCGNNSNVEVFDYYPKKYIPKEICFDFNMPTKFAGIDVSKQESLQILKNLDFKIIKTEKEFLVTSPINRMDIESPEDLAVEVVRMFGYDKIPSNEISPLEITPDITPKNIFLSEKMRDILTSLGFDEVLSLPLVQKNENPKVNWLDWQSATTQNSVNENYPDLRQSLATGLIIQLNQYLKKNIEYTNIFEIGKVFGVKKGVIKKELQHQDFIENNNLGILMCSVKLPLAKETIEKVLRQIGLVGVFYLESEIKPQTANPYSCWDISSGEQGEKIGIFYKLNPEFETTFFAEFNIDKIIRILEKSNNKPAVELSKKLIILDANIELKNAESIANFMINIKNKIKSTNFWDIKIIDKFPLEKKTRYTLRVAYKELSDQQAKQLHLNIFSLK